MWECLRLHYFSCNIIHAMPCTMSLLLKLLIIVYRIILNSKQYKVAWDSYLSDSTRIPSSAEESGSTSSEFNEVCACSWRIKRVYGASRAWRDYASMACNRIKKAMFVLFHSNIAPETISDDPNPKGKNVARAQCSHPYKIQCFVWSCTV